MTRKLPALLLPLFLFVFVSAANAQTAITATTPIMPAANVITTSTANTPTAIDAATKLKLQMQLLQDQKAAALAKVRSDASAAAQTIRDNFKAKLLLIKDQRKQALVERIDARIAEVNKDQATRYSEVLVRLQGFLDIIKQSTTSATIIADVTGAQAAIDTATAAVTAQAAKPYTMTIADDTTLKLNAGTTVSQFRQDLTTVYKLVINAKQAVQKLNIDKSTIKKEATSSAGL